MNTDNNKPTRKALGRGLAALIPTAASPAGKASSSSATTGGLRSLGIDLIKPNPDQPRKTFDPAPLSELADSIKANGVLQPIVVRRVGEGYEIVAGERRWRAAAKAGLDEIPAVVKDLGDTEMLQVALIENIQREDLDPLEEAHTYSRLLKDHGLTQENLAQAVGKNRATIANSLRLLKLPEPVLDMLGTGKLSPGHARALMTLGDERQVETLASQIVSRGMSVRDAEAAARRIKKAGKSKKAAEPKSLAETSVEERLMRALSTKVRLVHRKGKGRIEIAFHSLDQLDEILNRIAP